MTAPTRPTVFVLDDDIRVRRTLRRLIASAGYPVELFGSTIEFLERTAEDRPGCVVVDLKLPGPNGTVLLGMLQAPERTIPLVFITGHGGVSASVHTMKAGAVDFLTKPANDMELLEAIAHALARDAEQRQQRAEHAELQARLATLTRRERQVFDLVVQGFLNKQIAGRLGTTEQTIKVHRRRVMQKMRAASLAELVHLSERTVFHIPLSANGKGHLDQPIQST